MEKDLKQQLSPEPTCTCACLYGAHERLNVERFEVTFTAYDGGNFTVYVLRLQQQNP